MVRVQRILFQDTGNPIKAKKIILVVSVGESEGELICSKDYYCQ